MSKAAKLKTLGIVVFVIASVAVVAGGFLIGRHEAHPKLSSSGQNFTLLVAKTAAEQAQGLGGRTSLPKDEGMVFVFSSEGTHCFWMKNMRFPLDIVWLNAQKKVVALKQNVSPNTYPEQFCPSMPAQYTIELNAGQIQAGDIKLGQTLSF